jgi:hypothetical protein
MRKIIAPHPLPLPTGERGRVRGVLVIWILDNWNLSGIWNLIIGILYID